jgi:hypothetical protein
MKDPIEMEDEEIVITEADMEAARARLSVIFAGHVRSEPHTLIYNPDGSWHDETTGQDFDAAGDLIEEYDDDDDEEEEE